MGILTSVLVNEIKARGSIRDSDVLRLKAALCGEHALGLADAEALLALHGACPVKDPAWAAFFVDTLTDFVVNQMKPEGYIIAENAQWLIGQVSRDGRIRSSAELELMVRVIERARWSPPNLAAFVLGQVREAVASGTGPLRTREVAERGTIPPSEIALVRRTVLAFGRECKLAITRSEAEALLAIDDAVAPGQSSPLWTDFVVQTVGHAVLAALGRWVPSRDELLRDSVQDGGDTVVAWTGVRPGDGAGVLAAAGARMGGFSGQGLAGGSGSRWSISRPLTSEERAMARLERQRLEIVTNEAIEEPDEVWLTGRLGEAPELGANKVALLAFLLRESNGLPKGLKDLAARAMIAA